MMTVQSLRSDSNFWEQVTQYAGNFDVSEPCVPRFEEGNADGEFDATPLQAHLF